MVFVYDVNIMITMDSLDSWVEEVEMHGVPMTVPRVLVGNKCDEDGQVLTPVILTLRQSGSCTRAV